MKLKEKIVADRISAMKSGNTEQRLVLSTVLGELDRISKDPTDDVVIKIVKKMVESNKECGTTDQNQYLDIYLPQMIGMEKLKEIIIEHMTENEYIEMKDMGKVMKFLKENYSGQFDGRLASTIIKMYFE